MRLLLHDFFKVRHFWARACFLQLDHFLRPASSAPAVCQLLDRRRARAQKRKEASAQMRRLRQGRRSLPTASALY